MLNATMGCRIEISFNRNQSGGKVLMQLTDQAVVTIDFDTRALRCVLRRE